MSEMKSSASASANEPVVLVEKIEIDPSLLSPSLARDLARLPKEELAQICSVRCKVDFTRDMAAGIRFVDAVAGVINQRYGLFTTMSPKKRIELEKAREQIIESFRSLIHSTVHVARQFGLTRILERNWRLLSVYGPSPVKTGARQTVESERASGTPGKDEGPRI